MYNLSQVQEAITPGAQRPYLDAGIHDNIKLEAVRYDTSENGNKYIAFDFVDEQGAKLTHTE
jgi:hypothetical protein